ncbi:hypothetical protein MHB50_12470 [Siminovitchia sp. FSL H7-0308]|uniref:hypothetical protein n=1 Tax=Siminovitchia sp. FSL H7-0308 TaxID=2921432 RepID=UPI0030EE0C90
MEIDYLVAIYITLSHPHVAKVSDETGVLFEVNFAQMLKNDPFTGQSSGTKSSYVHNPEA